MGADGGGAEEEGGRGRSEHFELTRTSEFLDCFAVFIRFHPMGKFGATGSGPEIRLIMD